MKISLAFIFLILSIGTITALTCNPTFFTETFLNTNLTTEYFTVTRCNNVGGNSTSIILTGSSHLELYETVIGNAEKDIKLKLKPGITTTNHPFSLSFDGIPMVTGVITIKEPEIPPINTTGCRLIVMPYTTNYRIKQGETGSSSQIRIKVSTECPTLSMSVIEETLMSKPMYLQGQSGDIQPGQEFSFSIGLDAQDVSTGVYNNRYFVTGTVGNDIYQKEIFLSTTVTIGTSPIDENTFTNLPICTLDSDMSLNTTYSLVCDDTNPVIDIEVPYNEFFRGVGVEESEGRFEYQIKPVKIGNTKFIANFKYKGVPIGSPFQRDVRIMQGSTPIQGTELSLLFYQSGTKKSISSLVPGETNVLVKDSNTDTIVQSFTLYLNGVESNNTFTLESKDYELIVHSPGYLSKTINFTIKEAEITVTGLKDYYNVNEVMNLTTEPTNCSFLLDNSVITLPYTFKTSGTKILKVVKEGYSDFSKNVTIKSLITAMCTPETDDWKKGKKIICELSNSTEWEVYRGGDLIEKGTGELVEFKIDDYGNWEIREGTNYIKGKYLELPKTRWYKFWSLSKWYHWVELVIVLVVLIYLGTKAFGKKKGEGLSFVGQPAQQE